MALVLYDDGPSYKRDQEYTDDLEIDDDLESHSEAQSLLVLDAVRNKDEFGVRNLLEKGANLRATTPDGQTALHLAVITDNNSMVKLLLEKGADAEVVDDNGRTPLYVAAGSGKLAVVECLLQFNANVESYNPESEKTAFYQAVENGHAEVAKFLLEHGADIDTRIPDGHTPLFMAVKHGNLKLVKFLLQYGANKKMRLENGQRIEDFARGDNTMMDLLRSDHLLQGPSITDSKTGSELRFTHVSSLPADQTDKLIACHGFEATIVDFFVGDREQRIQVSSSIHEIIYGRGPEAIMASVKGTKMDGQRPLFRWYHLPANNMEWVEGLVGRLYSERDSGAAILDEELKSKLALTNSAGRQYRASTAHSSFMRPLCRTVKSGLDPSLAGSKADQIMLFIIRDVTDRDRESQYVKKVPPLRYSRSLEREFRGRPINVVMEDDAKANETESSEDRVGEASALESILHGTKNLRSIFRNLRGRLRIKSDHMAKVTGLSLQDSEDLEQGTRTGEIGEKVGSGTSVNPPEEDASQPASTGDEKKEIVEKISAEKSEDQTEVGLQGEKESERGAKNNDMEISSAPKRISAIEQERLTPDKEILPQSLDHQVPPQPSIPLVVEPLTTQTVRAIESNSDQIATETTGQDQQNNHKSSDPTLVDTSAKGKSKVTYAPEESATKAENTGQEPDGASSERWIKSAPQKARISLKNIDEHLIKGYLLPTNLGEVPPLQLRRTLDQYFYTHLASTSQRDSDQVVYRYALRHDLEPKIFMVDQLWLWILNDDTVISCCPQRWDISSDKHPHPTQTSGPLPRNRTRARGSPPPPPPSPPSNMRAPQDGFMPSTSTRVRRAPPSPPPPSGWLRDPPPNPKHVQIFDAGRGPTAHKHNHLSQSKSKSRKHSSSGVFRRPGAKSASLSARRYRRRSDDEPLIDYYSGPADMMASSIEDKKKRLAFLEKDPLNVHQMILKHLQGSARAPITSVYDLASLISDSCINVFDQYQVPDEFQFLDFFERSIGSVIDQEAHCFQEFAESLANEKLGYDAQPGALFNITTETELLVEIKDIRDELGILQMVLSDQLKILEEFDPIMSRGKGVEAPLSAHKVLESHLYRIENMEKLAEKTYQALNHLLDLKQKQANVSEALFSRKQAEITAGLAKQGMEQALLDSKQAEETVRQGKTVLVFTVITIIFLPLSFMAAFFAINIDAFPLNDNGKLPISYVLKYMLSVSGAVSIPFIFVAFNQDRIARLLTEHRAASAICIAVTFVLAILLSVIWTRDLASGIKTAVSVAIVMLAIVGAIAYLISWLIDASLGINDSSSVSSSLLDD